MGSIREAAKCTVHTLPPWLEHDSLFIIIFVGFFLSIFFVLFSQYSHGWNMTASSSDFLRISCSFCHCIFMAERWQPLHHYIHGKINLLYFVHYCCHISMERNMAGTWQPLHHFLCGHICGYFHIFFFFICKGCLLYVFPFLLFIIIYISRAGHGCNITAFNHHISSHSSHCFVQSSCNIRASQ